MKPVYRPFEVSTYRPNSLGMRKKYPCMENLLQWLTGQTNDKGYVSRVGSDDRDIIGGRSLKFDGVGYVTNSTILSTDTVSHSGTAVSTVSAGRIDFTAGTVWDLTITRGGTEVFRCPCVEGQGTTVANVIDEDNPLTLVSAPSDIWHEHTDGGGSKYLDDYGFSERENLIEYSEDITVSPWKDQNFVTSLTDTGDGVLMEVDPGDNGRRQDFAGFSFSTDIYSIKLVSLDDTYNWFYYTKTFQDGIKRSVAFELKKGSIGDAKISFHERSSGEINIIIGTYATVSGTFYIRKCLLIEGEFDESKYIKTTTFPIVGNQPASYTNQTIDWLGNDLQNKGRAKRNLLSAKAPAFVGDGVCYGVLDSSITLSGDFEIEASVYLSPVANNIILATADSKFVFSLNYAGKLTIEINTNWYPSSLVIPIGFSVLKVKRVGSIMEYYLNGVLGDSLTVVTDDFRIDRITNYNGQFNGQMFYVKVKDSSGNPVFHYSFTEGTPTKTALKVFDRSGNGNHLTLNSASAANWQLVERPDWPLLDGFSVRENLVKTSEGLEEISLTRASKITGIQSPVEYDEGIGLVADTTTNSHYICYKQSSWAIDTPGNTVYCQCVIKAGDKKKARMQFILYDPTPSVVFDVSIFVDISTTTVYSATSTIENESIISISDGWVLVKFSAQVHAGLSVGVYNYLNVFPLTGTYSTTFTGDDSTVDLYIAMMSCSRNGFDYIKTTDTPIVGQQPALTATPATDAAGNTTQYPRGKTFVGNVYGDELVKNQTFDDDSYWTIVGESTISDGVARILSTAGDISSISQSILTAGSKYLIKYDVLSHSGANLHNSSDSFIYPSDVGHHEIFYTADDDTLMFKSGGITDTVIDNISVKEILQENVNPMEFVQPYDVDLIQADSGTNLWFDGAGGRNTKTISDLVENLSDQYFEQDNKYLVYEEPIVGTCKTKTEKYLG